MYGGPFTVFLVFSVLFIDFFCEPFRFQITSKAECMVIKFFLLEVLLFRVFLYYYA